MGVYRHLGRLGGSLNRFKAGQSKLSQDGGGMEEFRETSRLQDWWGGQVRSTGRIGGIGLRGGVWESCRACGWDGEELSPPLPGARGYF